MKKNLMSVLLGGLLTTVLSSCPAIAYTPQSLETIGDKTYDPNTGLEWLDLDLTAGQSYNSVLNGWNGYTTTEGFRFATRDEVIQLFMDAGASSIGTSVDNVQAATLALSFLDTTSAVSDRSDFVFESYMFYDPSTEPNLPPDYVPSAGFGIWWYAGDPEEGYFDVPVLLDETSHSSPWEASALVKEVPEPSSCMLINSCLGLCLFLKHRVKR